MNNYFNFIKTEEATDFRFNSDMEDFRKIIDEESNDNLYSESTIRELIQNSIDARLNLDEPVYITINLEEINKKDIPGIDEVFEHINSLSEGNEYTAETIKYMKSRQDIDKVNVLTFEDENTKGLSRKSYNNEKSIYDIYAYTKGVHGNDNSIDESIRGGSHGVGKIAINAASDIHLMYFANCDEDNNQNLGGSVELFDHKKDDKYYRGQGIFSKLDTYGKRTPYENKEFHEIFKKDTRGLKIIIPYLRFNNSIKEIAKSIINNFFIAILEDILTVKIKHKENSLYINKDNLEDIVNNETFYPLNDEKIVKNQFTPRYVNTYLNQKPIAFDIHLDSKNDYHFNLYFGLQDPTLKNGRTAIFRSLGMKIEDRKVKSRITTSYNAILIGGSKEDAYIKTLENKSHTKMTKDSIRDSKISKNATRFLNTLDKELTKIIDVNINKSIEAEGTLNTEDLFHKVNLTFNNKIKENLETLQIEGDNINLQKINKKEKRKEKTNSSKIKVPIFQRKQKRVARKLQMNKEDSNIMYILDPDIVKRAVLRNIELLEIDLNDIGNLEKLNKVNLGFRIISGDGKEYENEFNIKTNYDNIKDSRNSTLYQYDFNWIYDVVVINNKIKLYMELSKDANVNLKYTYKLEVKNDI